MVVARLECHVRGRAAYIRARCRACVNATISACASPARRETPADHGAVFHDDTAHAWVGVAVSEAALCEREGARHVRVVAALYSGIGE
jgi:hypothetical protein